MSVSDLPSPNWKMLTDRTWEASLRVSVVLPVYNSSEQLKLTLSGLARQSYPSDLVEIIVADDGSDPPADVPPLIGPFPASAVWQQDAGFRLAAARNLGARHASGDVIIFLDGDMIPEDGWLEAHARWHHLDPHAMTLGFRRHVDVRASDQVALVGASPGTVFSGRPNESPEWIEGHMARTKELTSLDDDIFRVVTGGNLGVSAALFEAIGGFDERFVRWGAEDVEFGFRALTAGALLVPARQALAWHQGLGTTPDAAERPQLEVQRSFISHLIADPGFRRQAPGRTFELPYLAVELDASELDLGGVRAKLDDVLGSPFTDLVVELELPADPHQALLVEAEYAGDTRVRIDRRMPAPIRLRLGDAPIGPLLPGLNRELKRAGVVDIADSTAWKVRWARRFDPSDARDESGLPVVIGVIVAHARRSSIGSSSTSRPAPPANSGPTLSGSKSDSLTVRSMRRLRRVRSIRELRPLLRAGAAELRSARAVSAAQDDGAALRGSGPSERPLAIQESWIERNGRAGTPAEGEVGPRVDVRLEDGPTSEAHGAVGTDDDLDRVPLVAVDEFRFGERLGLRAEGEDPAEWAVRTILSGGVPNPGALDAGTVSKLGDRFDAVRHAWSDDDAERSAVRLWRRLGWELRPAGRFADLLASAGWEPPPVPEVSILLPLSRPEFVERAISSAVAQTYERIEVVVVAHGIEVPERLVESVAAIVEVPGDVPFGEALNRGTHRCSGGYVAKMDDDDWYSREHILDLVLGAELAGAPIVGKAAEFVYLAGSDVTIRRFVGGAGRHTRTIAGGALLVDSGLLDAVGGWRRIRRHVDQGLFEDAEHIAGITPLRIHGFGYLLNRHGVGHTWDADEKLFLSQAVQRRSGFVPEWAMVEGARR